MVSGGSTTTSWPSLLQVKMAAHNCHLQQLLWPRIQTWIYYSNTCAIKLLPERLCLFHYVHRLTQFPISEHQSDCCERQAFRAKNDARAYTPQRTKNRAAPPPPIPLPSRCKRGIAGRHHRKAWAATLAPLPGSNRLFQFENGVGNFQIFFSQGLRSFHVT